MQHLKVQNTKCKRGDHAGDDKFPEHVRLLAMKLGYDASMEDVARLSGLLRQTYKRTMSEVK
jgi:hypothetical protein